MDKRKLLIASTTFPDFNKNHIPNHFLSPLVLCFQKCGYDIDIISPKKIGLKKHSNYQNINIYRFNWPLSKYSSTYNNLPTYKKNALNLISQFFLIIEFIKKIKSLTNKKKYNLIWAPWFQNAYIASLATKNKIPIFTTILGSDIRNYPKIFIKIMRNRIKFVLNMFSNDLEISNWIKEFNLKEILVNNVYIPKNIDKINHNNFNIIVIGRLENNDYHTKAKGISVKMFKCLEKLTKKNKNIKSIIIGDGKALKEYKILHKNGIFLGWLNNFDKYLSTADLIIGASGICGTTIDAISNKIPLLISKYDPAKSFWKNQSNCIIYNPENIKNIQEKIEYSFNKKKNLTKIVIQAKNDLSKICKPINQEYKNWEEQINKFILEFNQKL